MDDFPEAAPGRPVWLITLADLALLLVGFFVFVQASRHLDGKAVAQSFRTAFDAPAEAEPMAVASAGMLDFTPGSAELPQSPEALIAWARAATRDPRVRLTVKGETDGSVADVDPLTGSAALLAADRARAVARVLAGAHAISRDRLTVETDPRPGRRAAMVSLGFAGKGQP